MSDRTPLHDFESFGLSNKQAAFVREYVLDFNATGAAIRAGYAEPSARIAGANNLTNESVRAAIRQATAKYADQYVISRERVLAELAFMGFANLQDFYVDGVIDLSKLTRQQWAAVQEITIDTVQNSRNPERRDDKITRTRVKLFDKKSALIELGRMMGWVDDKGQPTKAAEPGSEDYKAVRQAALLELSELAKPIVPVVLDQFEGQEPVRRAPETRKDK